MSPQHCASPVHVCAASKQHSYAVAAGRHELAAAQHPVAIVHGDAVAAQVAPPQTPALHVCPAAHACAQVPQLVMSDWVFTQRPLQNICPAGHAHPPDWQVVPPAQRFPHAPQFALSFWRSVQRPPHVAEPAAQPQTPAVHDWPAAHAVAQFPQ